MNDKVALVSEIVVAGFDDSQTAFLARAALARLQDEMAMATEDVAIVLLGPDGEVAVQQSLNRNGSRKESSAFWGTLADLLFVPGSSAGTTAKGAFDMYAKAGIDPASASRIITQLELCRSALLVRTGGGSQRERVVGVLRGFDGQLASVPILSNSHGHRRRCQSTEL